VAPITSTGTIEPPSKSAARAASAPITHAPEVITRSTSAATRFAAQPIVTRRGADSVSPDAPTGASAAVGGVPRGGVSGTFSQG
jgi:hypothetical protein